MRHFAVVALLCIAQALAGPAARDLASDVNVAENNLARWDVEINSLENRLSIFNDEISTTINGIYGDIKTNLALIPDLDNGTASTLVMAMDDSILSANANISEAIESLTTLRQSLIATNTALAGDLTALSTVVDTLKADFDAATMAISDMVTNVEAGFGGVDAAVREALDSLSGVPVIQCLVALQRVTDVVDNERFELTNAQILFEYRAGEAFSALKVVVDQV